MLVSAVQNIWFLLLSICVVAHNENQFEATLGCLQYNAHQGYNFAHPYYSTAVFKHIHKTSQNVTTMRMGVLGKIDCNIRLSPLEYPYDNTEMNEIRCQTVVQLHRIL
ncbi:uncharacterized protein LOC129765357 isoform X2 [Toxorhynchites rutilus septentrionalis]|uniref:uncharacterized protein LOC129765357 isoform X2 n=1 Tax=Toxorhynchites rutilus septentrionalis TaxID=329112 RepID=UPI00247A124E|nr:uncharacterized protein LOC129765357 isoform X2 [Toxorhynchites rutilus septentrionalis]